MELLKKTKVGGSKLVHRKKEILLEKEYKKKYWKRSLRVF